jgi:hypothetical protein
MIDNGNNIVVRMARLLASPVPRGFHQIAARIARVIDELFVQLFKSWTAEGPNQLYRR